MEFKRRKEINRINVEIRSSEYAIKRLITQRQLLNPSIASHQERIKKIEERIEKKTSELLALQQKSKDIKNGDYDTEIENEYKKNMDAHFKRSNDKKEKVKQYKEQKRQQKENLQNHYKSIRKNTNSDKYLKRELHKFHKMMTQFPSKLEHKLENMSNNMGYMWRGLNFYGKITPDENNKKFIIFEKNDNKLLTHYYNIRYDGSVSYNQREKVLYEKKT